jgi:hypothetical protein
MVLFFFISENLQFPLLPPHGVLFAPVAVTRAVTGFRPAQRAGTVYLAFCQPPRLPAAPRKQIFLSAEPSQEAYFSQDMPFAPISPVCAAFTFHYCFNFRKGLDRAGPIRYDAVLTT